MDECKPLTPPGAEEPSGDVDDLIFPAGPDWYVSER